MLTELYIQNLAVIEKVSISFDSGLNVFTGETGAGKSIVIDAINAILGGRTSREIVRSGEKKAVISAMFNKIPLMVRQVIQEYGIEIEEDEIVIQREISADGKSVARVCGMPVTVAMLKEIGTDLIAINGQHDHQKLLSPENHIDILDSFGNFHELLADYQERYLKLKNIEKELEHIQKNQAQKEQKIDILSYQIKEIEDAQLELKEEETLLEERKVLKNATKITENLAVAYESLYGNDEFDGAVDLLADANGALSEASEYYIDLQELATQLEDLAIQVKESASDVANFAENSEFDATGLDAIEERINEIQKLKRKYGNTIEEIFAFYHNAKEQLEEIEMYDTRLNELILDQNKVEKETQLLAERLSRGRKAIANTFIKTVSEELTFLDMPNVRLEVRFGKVAYNTKGTDKVEFLISTNLGEALKPLAKIASGGELSRIMLSIKNALADKDAVPTLIFDEIDTGVSGSAAQKIGLKLKQAAGNRQLLCVTHSAQIAALADTHYFIRKSAEHGKTYTKVQKLNYEQRKTEIARIMGTGVTSKLLLENAEEMLFNAQKAVDNKK